MSSSIQMLLIDDNPDDRMLAAHEIRKHFPEMNILEAGQESEFARLLAQGGFDLVITDYHLQWTDGLAIFHRIRDCFPDCPVILYTGTGNAKIAEEALREGMDDFVLKSENPRIYLIKAIQRALNQTEHKLQTRLAESRLRELFATLPIGILLFGSTGKVIDANPAMAEMLGFPNYESLLQTEKYVLFESSQARAAFLQELRKHREIRGLETRLRRKDGSLFWARLHAYPLPALGSAAGSFEALVENIQDRKTEETARLEKELALRQSEYRYRTLAEAAHDMIFIIGPANTIEYANSFACFSLGMPAEEVVGKKITHFFPPETSQPQVEAIREIFEKGEPRYHEEEIPFSGRPVWLGTWLAPIRDENGAVQSVLGVARDITTRVEAEQQYKKSADEYRSLVETSPDGILLRDAKREVTFANRKMLEMIGATSLDDIRGMHFSQLVVPEHKQRAQSNTDILLRTGSIRNMQYSLRQANGSFLPIEISSSTVRDTAGHLQSITSIVRDISAREEQERARRESEARFQVVFEESAIGIAIVSPQGDLLDFNPALSEILGFPREELLSMNVRTLLLPDSEAAGEALFHHIREPYAGSFRQQFLLRRASGSTVWCRLTLSSVCDSQAKFLYSVGLIEDISKQIETEQSLRQAGEAMQQYADRLATLHEIDKAIQEARSLEEISSATLVRIGELIPSQRSSILLFDYKQQAAHMLDVRSYTKSAYPKGIVVPFTNLGVDMEKLRQGEPFAIEDLIQLASPTPFDRKMLEEGIRSFLSLPMISRGELIGSLNFSSAVPSFFRREHAEVAAEVANLLAVAITQARLFEQVQQHSAELEAIASLNVELRAPLPRQEITGIVLRRLMDLFACDSAAMLDYDPERERFLISQGLGLFSASVGNLVPDAERRLHAMLFSNRPIFRSRITSASEFDFLTPQPSINGIACIPLLIRGRSLGMLFIAHTHLMDAVERTFQDADVPMLLSVGEVAAGALHRAMLMEQTEQRLRRLSALHVVDMAISASIDLRVTLSVLLDQITSQLNAQAADVLLLNPHTQLLTWAAGRGLRSSSVSQTQLRLGQGFAGTAALERRTVTVSHLDVQTDMMSAIPREEAASFSSYFATPLIAKGQIKGVLEIFSREPVNPDPEWLEYLETMANQAAIAVENASLFEDLQRTNTDLVSAYDATIEGWSRALELHDHEPTGHTLRVADATIQLARAMGVRNADLIHIRRGALIHDIGKMAIPDTILQKKGPLTEEEQEIMRRHPTYAFELLAPIGYLRPAMDIPYYHHENWDGSGYPHGLIGDQIPLAARLFAIVDVWDALLNERPQREAWPEEQVEHYLQSQSGKQFDPKALEIFLRMVEEDKDDSLQLNR